MGNRAAIIPRLMTKAEAAAYLHVSGPTFVAWCPIRPVKIGSVERYDRAQIDAWLDRLTETGQDKREDQWLERL